MKSKIITVFLLLAAILLALRIYHQTEGSFKLKRISNIPTERDKNITQIMLSNDYTFIDRYHELFLYFFSSFINNTSHDYAMTNYPGMLSKAGNSINQIEGTARTLPLLAAWTYSGRDHEVIVDGKKVNIINIIKRSILSGTDKSSPNYWGDIVDYNQRILEASDITRSLWLTKKDIWDKLATKDRDQIAQWLAGGANAKTANNNWLLAPVIIQLFLQNTGYISKVDTRNYFQFKKNYLENGWFRDGKTGPVDYYNAWGISYDLFWIYTMGNIDNDFIKQTLARSSDFTAHLISTNGVAYMGRSMCYRTAIPTPIIINGLLNNTEISQGVAKSALDYTWKYFISHQALVSGTLSMGYFNNDERFVNNYTGSGSCLWGLRSLVISFMNKSDSYLWLGQYKKLPIEISNYTINAEKLGWIVTGSQKTGEIKITIPRNKNNTPTLKKNSTWVNLRLRLSGKIGRADQYALEYLKPYYSSMQPLSNIEHK